MPEQVRTDEAPPFELFDLPISQAVIHGDTVYVSGQTGVEPETRQALENVAAILDAAGSSFDDVIKATLFVEDLDDFATVNAVYEEFVSEPYPARSAVEVSDLAMEFAIEFEVIAAV